MAYRGIRRGQPKRGIRKYRLRRSDRQETLQKFLIVCEGKQTEPNYLRCFRGPNLVVEAKGLGVSPRQLVEEALELGRQGEYDQIRCVFDRDDCSVSDFNGAVQRAVSQGVRVAYSNQAFELWYLLHFHFYNTPMRREDYFSKLSESLPRPYEKNDPHMYDQLFWRQATALDNAERLLNRYSPPNPGTDDPSTTVHLLVRELNRFLPETRAKRE